MGNCNFKTEYETDNVTGEFVARSLTLLCSCDEEPLLVHVRHRPRRLRKGLEGRKEKGEETLRHERDDEGADHLQTLGQLGHEREKVPAATKAPVSSQRCSLLQFPGQHAFRLSRP